MPLARVPSSSPGATEAVSARGVGREARQEGLLGGSDIASRLARERRKMEVLRLMVVTGPFLAPSNAEECRGEAAGTPRLLPRAVMAGADGHQTVSIGGSVGQPAPFNGERRGGHRPFVAVDPPV